MEAVWDFGLDVSRWLQETYPGQALFFSLISDLGRFEFYLAILPLIYWCLDKRLGTYLTYVLAFSDLLNAGVKHLTREPRPYWLDGRLQLSSEPTYGLPSAHAQSVVVAYVFLAAWLRRGWVWLLCLLMVILTGLARLYLGVHFLHQVVAGFMLGILILLGFSVWERYLAQSFVKRILGQRLLIVLLVPTVMAVLYTAGRLLVGAPDLAATWNFYIPAAEQESLESVASGVGTLFGLGVGFVLERSRVRFVVAGPAWKKILRYLLGIFVALLIWRGLGIVFAVDLLWLAIPLRILRYLLLGLWAAYYAPMLFVRLRLAQANPEPEISLAL
ncbi:MAG: phosphatase PAP2 family protein [Chloroflexota bacterium]